MNAQHAIARSFAANTAAARHMNLDFGTYRAAEREQGRGYGRSVGYAAPRPYTSQPAAGALFRIR